MNFHRILCPARSRCTCSTSISCHSRRSSAAALCKERKLSVWMTAGRPRRAMKRRRACSTPTVDISGTSSRCTARDTMHVIRHTYRGVVVFLVPRTNKGPAKSMPTWAKAGAGVVLASGRSAIFGWGGRPVAQRHWRQPRSTCLTRLRPCWIQ
ncbi:hypothetical protein T07_10534 [Trichinella nelsoni]|uniref:Uncharacterized protein n=1 Tax=Trichinella nelsoni TaxID=6336 RepID=A0A0V0RN86_9BILA|nr:hypothetical protein T07_10534 [Trichinella nelsoni]